MTSTSILPHETMSAICVEFAFDIEDAGNRAFEVWKSLAAVNRGWRSVARQTSQLWTVLAPVRHQRSPPTAHFPEQVTLAGNRPLQLVWPEWPHALEDSVDAIASLANGLHSMQYTSSMRALSRQSLGALPRVTAVEISMWGPASTDALRALQDTPAVRSLALRLLSDPDDAGEGAIPVTLSVPRQQCLTSLSLHSSARLVFHARTCIEFLRTHRATLTRVAITGRVFWPPGMPPSYAGAPEMGALLVLTLSRTAAMLTRVIRAPRIRDLEIQDTTWLARGDSPLATCLESRPETFTNLHLTRVAAVVSATVEDAVALLEPCQSVETLVLDYSGPSSSRSRFRFALLMMHALVYSTVLPSLTDLHVWHSSGEWWSDLEFLDDLQQAFSTAGRRDVAIHVDLHRPR